MGAYKLTNKDVFIESDLFMHLLTWIKDWDGTIPTPAIILNKGYNRDGSYEFLWTGKQAFSLILPVKKISYH